MSDRISSLNYYIQQWVRENRIPQYFKYNYGALGVKVDMDKLTCIYDKPSLRNYRKSPLPAAKVVFTTNYTNNTDLPQEVDIKTQRTTSATAVARVKHGFTSDHGVGLKLRIPNEVVSVFGGDVDLDAEEEEIVEQKMVWTFSTKVTAPPRRKTVAKFEVKEERVTYDFDTYVHVKGKVNVEVRVKATNEPLLEFQENIRTILEEYLPKADENSIEKNIVYLGAQSVEWPFRGTLDFRYGISQNEEIE